MRLVTVTPAGRRRYVEILASYLLQNRDVISEHQWWLNTRNPADVAYLFELTDRYPGFFRIVHKPMVNGLPIGHAIWRYMSDCTDEQTVYLRLDDDICYVAPDSIQRLLKFRLDNPEPFMVLGNIVNNAICTHFHQQAGVIPDAWGEVEQECMGDRGWRDPKLASRVHRRFLKDLSKHSETNWKSVPFDFDGVRRFSINAICWFGRDFAGLEEVNEGKLVDEEPFLTADVPQRLNRPTAICPDALFAHFAFYTQRDYLETAAPDLLAKYAKISQRAVVSKPTDSTWFDALRWTGERAWGGAAWRAKMARRALKGHVRSLTGRRQKSTRND